MNGEKIKGNLLVETLILTIFFKNQTYRKNSAGCLHLKNISVSEFSPDVWSKKARKVFHQGLNSC